MMYLIILGGDNMRKEDAKRLKNLRRQDEFIIDEKQLLKASCDHMIEGRPKIKPLGGQRGICTICGKVIDFSNLPSTETLQSAMNTVTTAIDLLKLGNDDLDDDVRQELGRIVVHGEAIKKLYKKTKKNATERPRKHMYPGMAGADVGMGSYLFRALGGGYMGGQVMDDSDMYGNFNKKKKNKNKKKYFNEYDD